MRRIALMVLCLFAVTMPGMAQDRMPPIPAEKQTPEQRKAAEAFRANRKQDVFGPFVPLHRSPEVMLRAMALGDFLRYRTVFPAKLNEFIILITSRHYTQHYEWYLLASDRGRGRGLGRGHRRAAGERPRFIVAAAAGDEHQGER